MGECLSIEESAALEATKEAEAMATAETAVVTPPIETAMTASLTDA